MKSRIFMYLFIFAILLVLFQYMNTKNYATATTDRIEQLTAKTKKLEDSLAYLNKTSGGSRYFSLEGNEEALSYFEDLDVEDLPRYIADKLLETNELRGDNPLIPYAGMNGPVKINKIEVLNHKWIVADFSDGKYWGELFITYAFTINMEVEFTVISHLLYNKG